MSKSLCAVGEIQCFLHLVAADPCGAEAVLADELDDLLAVLLLGVDPASHLVEVLLSFFVFGIKKGVQQAVRWISVGLLATRAGVQTKKERHAPGRSWRRQAR